ncbi:DUF1398 family protein [Chitinimonas koreensis]|uniref:DUF1398 family protein n=1 Tax=Chitinimonas koreensis TaxID=356302 RepID=UPI00042118DE|nr:DUF1398 family protein [Chitinimonas koreensis]QNM95436.1 DUF1398 family protein [Chitinimonas koreensis]
MQQDTTAQAAIEDYARRSHAGTIDFGSVVRGLAAAGVASYHADYRRRETAYYLADDTVHALHLPAPDIAIADGFNAEAVAAAVRGAQRGEVAYPDFMRLTMAAGCVGYLVWIDGRQVQYFGRRGEIHVEHFPQR